MPVTFLPLLQRKAFAQTYFRIRGETSRLEAKLRVTCLDFDELLANTYPVTKCPYLVHRFIVS